MNVKELVKNIMVAIFATIHAFLVEKNRTTLKIKKNKIYIFDNGFDEIEIVLTLEDEEELRYDSDIVTNMSYDFIEVLKGNTIEVILVSDLYAIKGIEYNV